MASYRYRWRSPSHLCNDLIDTVGAKCISYPVHNVLWIKNAPEVIDGSQDCFTHVTVQDYFFEWVVYFIREDKTPYTIYDRFRSAGIHTISSELIECLDEAFWHAYLDTFGGGGHVTRYTLDGMLK